MTAELPRDFVRRVVRDLGAAEAESLCRSLDGEACACVRVNPSKAEGLSGVSPERVSAVLPKLEAAARIPWSAEGFLLRGRPSFTFDSDFHAGAYYVQEAASQFVGHLLGPSLCAGMRVLDLCAAPGGKTTLYATLVGREGLVVANEIDRRRASVLADNVRKWGMGNVAVTACDPRTVCGFESWFDVVAVDAPCSGEGMFRKDPAARGEWSEHNVRQCAARQDEILREAWRALRPGGVLLYSTCTFNRDENEGSLERMLAWAGPEAAAAELPEVAGAWGVESGSVGVFRTFRFYPHRTVGEGFFAAVARKSPEASGRPRVPKGHRPKVTPADRTTVGELRRWLADPDRMLFGMVGDTCYAWYGAQAEAVKRLSEALPVICSGVALGQVFKGRLRPDPSLAFFDGLRREAVPVAEVDEAMALRYLRRQDVAAPGFAEGLNLVTARGRSLGFAKRIGTRVNNMYPNSLRILRQE